MRKVAVITGAAGGIGKEITRAVAEAGYHVIMLCYTPAKGEAYKNQLVQDTGNPYIEVYPVDFSSMTSVDRLSDTLLERYERIDLLMNNAGTISTHFARTADGLERTVAVNYMAPFLLTLKLVPLMRKGSRIVNMISLTYASGEITPEYFTHGKKGHFWRLAVYKNTKLALWLFTRTLSQRLVGKGISVNAVDPGIVSTDIIRMNMWFDRLTDGLFRPFIRTPREGAETAIHLLLSNEVNEVSGQMYASNRPKRVKPKFVEHPQSDSLWNDTLAYFERLGIRL